MTIQFTDENFEQEVLQSDQPVLVDFWAEWCPPCRALGPVIDQVADQLQGEAKVGKLNVDHNKETAARYNVSSIPTVLVFNGGEVVETIVGLNAKEKYLDALNTVNA